MIETPDLIPHHRIAAVSPPRLWLRYGWAGLAGASVGLGVARLLYETDPHQFSAFGTALASLGCALIAAVLWTVLIWRADQHLPVRFPPAALLPLLISWLYIITPSMQVDALRGAVLIGGGILLSLALAAPWLIAPGADIPANRRWIGTTVVGLVIFAAYLVTLQRTIGRADTFEFQVTAPVLGVAHPTGYPLYILLGKVFSLIPLGTVATRVNLTSVIMGTLAVMIVYLTLRRVFGLDRFVSGLSALSFGLSPIFWSQAVIAEVYALHNAFAAAILGASLWLVVRYQHGMLSTDPATPAMLAEPKTRIPTRVVLILFALIGLSLTNHLTTVLLLPSVVVALFLARPPLTRKQWLTAFGLFLAALLIYLYIPLRWPALHEGRLMRFDEFIGWITGSRFQGALQLDAFLRDPERWRILARLILDQYGWLGVILSTLGFVLMASRQWRAALVSGLAFAAVTFYGLNYYVPDVGVFVIPLFLIQALWMGYGVSVTIGWAFARYSLNTEEWIHAALISAFALLPLTAAWSTGAQFDWSDEMVLEAWGRRVLTELPLAEDSAILADSEKIAPLEYLHRIEGYRPDMQMIVQGTEQEYLADLTNRIQSGQKVYLARFLPGLEGTYSLRSVGPLIEVGTGPLTRAPELDSAPVEWINGISLLGAEVADQTLRVGDEAWITLYWQAPEGINDNYQVRLRLIDQGGQVYWQSTPAFPVNNRYPPVAWKSSEIVPDFYPIPLPYTLYPGSYTVEVALAPPFSPDIALTRDAQEWVPAANLEIRSLDAALPIIGQRFAISFPEGALISLEVQAASTSMLTATWLRDQADVRTEYVLPAEGDAEFPILTQNSELAIHADRDDDRVIWSIGGAPVRCGWLMPLTGSCPLAEMLIRGEIARQAVANFDNQLLLTEVAFEAGRLQPGQLVDVTLTWQSLRQMSEDYTIFVHLLGPDGLLHGQVDAWPVQGTYPTSTWQIGETVEDRYLVPLDADAPPGAYQLEIGVYLLSTNTRLPVLNIDGLPIDDKILLDGLILSQE